jgi:hypothetical protein
MVCCSVAQGTNRAEVMPRNFPRFIVTESESQRRKCAGVGGVSRNTLMNLDFKQYGDGMGRVSRPRDKHGK